MSSLFGTCYFFGLGIFGCDVYYLTLWILITIGDYSSASAEKSLDPLNIF
jgi:hypothetical protein